MPPKDENAAEKRARELVLIAAAVDKKKAAAPTKPKQTAEEVIQEMRARLNAPQLASPSPLAEPEDVKPAGRVSKNSAKSQGRRGAKPGPRSNRSQVLEETRGVIEAFTCIGLIEGRMVPVPTENGQTELERMQVNDPRFVGLCFVPEATVDQLVTRWKSRAAKAGLPFWALPTEDLLLDVLRTRGIAKVKAHNFLKGLPRSGEDAWKRLAHFSRFVSECCEFSPSARVAHAEIYSAYNRWYEAQPDQPGAVDRARETLADDLKSCESDEAYRRYHDAAVTELGFKKFDPATFTQEICRCNAAFDGPGVKAVKSHVDGKHVHFFVGIKLRED
jgi:hypothetical protein